MSKSKLSLGGYLFAVAKPGPLPLLKPPPKPPSFPKPYMYVPAAVEGPFIPAPMKYISPCIPPLKPVAGPAPPI